MVLLEYNIDHINNAQIYWAYTRSNRPSQDLSYGWGSNSQWRTSFRFDFKLSNGFLYNAAARFDLTRVNSAVQEELSKDGLFTEEARELLKYRHFITSHKRDDDLFPYD